MKRLDDEEIGRRLAPLVGWERIDNAIRKTFTLRTFKDAMAFVNRVAELAEGMDHHPDMLVEYKRVTLTLTSHDAGGLTERDFRLAGRIDETA